MAGILKADKWINGDGTENYKCRAWVNFNGTGTVAIRASGNVSSITDNGTGNYTVNFATAMPDEKYSVSAINSESSSGTTATRVLSNSSSSGSLTNYTVNGVQLVITSGAGNNYDATLVSAVIFR